MEALTLRQLLAALTQAAEGHPERLDEPVTIEGCDCYDSAAAVQFIDKYGAGVTIRRGGYGFFEYHLDD